MTVDPVDVAKIVTLGEGFCVRVQVDVIAWIDMGDCGLVIDALELPELEDEVFAAITDTLGDKPVRWVLNTHTHGDHVALNGAFVRRWGAEIVNQQTAPAGPEGRWFEGPRRKVLMQPMPGCHTAEDCIVWVPEEKVLFPGDIFNWGIIPLIRRLTTDMLKLLEDTYQRLIDFGASVVVPGHGPLCTTAELERWVEYFNWLVDRCKRACESGETDEQITGELPPPEDMKGWWRFVQWKHADTVSKVLRAVRKGNL